jgi:hypothetical protein
MRSRESRHRLLEDISADIEGAKFWADHCGWEPGTGQCRKSRTPECQNNCPFRHLRLAEADQIRRNRQQRRPPQH